MNPRLQRSLGELGAAPPLAAVVLLAVNDHLLKGLFHNAITGKLSDLAICFVMPLLGAATLGLVGDWPVRRRLWISAAVSATVFALLEMSDGAEVLFQGAVHALGGRHVVLTRDASDLWAMLCVPLAVAYGRRSVTERQQTRWATITGAVALLGGGAALAATSPAAQCDHWSPPAVFQVEPGCGPGGVIVVEADSLFGDLTISNKPALGLPAEDRSDPRTDFRGTFEGGSCPFQLEDGQWRMTVGACLSNGTTVPPTADCLSRRECTVDKDTSGELWFRCHPDQRADQELCRSRLRAMP